MNIHLHNYEEFFILYLDNELSPDDRRQVEAFVLQHPELKEELNILSQYKIIPDTNIVFPGKASLLKDGAISSEMETELPGDNYTESLLLYADNELSADEKQSVEQFIAQNPIAAKELALLQLSKLEPETIHFPDKQSLYRREEKVRVISIRWWKVAAAAAIILAVGFSAFLLINRKKSQTPDEMANGPVKTEKQSPAVEQAANNKEKTRTIVPEPSHSTEIAKVNPAKTNPNKQLIKKEKAVIVPLKQKEQAPEVIVKNDVKASNNLPKPDETAVRVIAPEDMVAKSPRAKVVPETAYITPVTNDVVKTSYSQGASIDEPEIQSGGKKSKLRGFFRKLTRTFEKATKIDASDKDQVLIGGLAIKLK